MFTNNQVWAGVVVGMATFAIVWLYLSYALIE